MSREDLDGLIALGERVVAAARKRGADVAEAVIGEGAHLSAKVRLGEPELVEEAGSRAVGLRVMLGKQVSVSHTSDLSDRGIDRLIEDAIELARLSQPDDCAGPPEASLLSSRAQHAELDLYDPSLHRVDAGQALAHAKNAEAAALAFDPRITNSEGATFS